MNQSRKSGKPTTDVSEEPCPVARTLQIVGERWTILVLRELIPRGPLRFLDLERSLPGISPTTLSARLKTLEERGIVSKRLYGEHPPRYEYALTDKGKELRFALNALRKWGERHTG